MRRASIAALLVMLTFLTASVAGAWEFTLKGDAEWRYRYWTRTGDEDIFGFMDGTQVYLGVNHLKVFPTTGIQNPLTTAGIGVQAGENCFGKEMSFVDYRMTLYPRFQINRAIAIESSMNLTSAGTWSDRQPYNSSAAAPSAPGFVNSLYVPISEEQAGVDIPNTFVTMQYVKMAIATPMVNFSIGYKASAWGTGLWKHACSRPSTSFDISAPYGPFIFGFAPYFARSQSSWSLNGSTSRNEGTGAYQRQEQRRNYFFALEGYVIYRNADLDMGIMSDSYIQNHSNRVNARLAALTADTRPDSPDEVRYRVDTYMKYFNGRFFFNAEGAWFTRWRSGRGSADPASGAGTRRVRLDMDANAFLYGLDLGAVSGPAKMTLSYVRATGQDPATRLDNEDAGDAEQGASNCYMKDLGFLMYYMYGTGTGWSASGEGQPTDFHHLGARVDYAVASNLNVFVLGAYAWRDQPTGYTLGGDFKGSARRFTNDDIAMAQGIIPGYFGQVAVPDSARDIGYEIDGGFQWKLLENLVWKSTFAYWKPGTWWAYAYPNTSAIYRSNAGTVPAAGDPIHALNELGRDIAPLLAIETNLLINF